jgi:hypothetical protein
MTIAYIEKPTDFLKEMRTGIDDQPIYVEYYLLKTTLIDT